MDLGKDMMIMHGFREGRDSFKRTVAKNPAEAEPLDDAHALLAVHGAEHPPPLAKDVMTIDGLMEGSDDHRWT
jgi:hypothetical protein